DLALDLAGIAERAALLEGLGALDGDGRLGVDGLGAAGDALGDVLGGVRHGVGGVGGDLLRLVDGLVEEALGALARVFDGILDGVAGLLYEGLALLVGRRVVGLRFGGGLHLGRDRK